MQYIGAAVVDCDTAMQLANQVTTKQFIYSYAMLYLLI